MYSHFATLHKLAVHNKQLQQEIGMEEKNFQWYVTEIDCFIASVDIKKLRDTFSQFNISEETKNKLHDWLNEFTLIWNRWKGDISIGFSEVYRLATERAQRIDSCFQETINILEKMKKCPRCQELKEDLLDSLASFELKIVPIDKELDTLLTNITKFIESFDRQEKIFSEISKEICKEENIKTEDIADIEKTIVNYNNSIKELKNNIIAMGVIDGIGVIGCIGAIIGAFFTEGISLALLVPFLPVVGCTSYMIDQYKKQIQKFEEEIEEKRKEKQELKREILDLIAFNKTIKGISDRDNNIKEYVCKAKEPWEALSIDLKEIIAHIAILDSSTIDGYIKSFKMAKELWTNTFMPKIKQLKIENIKIVNTPENFVIETPKDWEEAIEKYSININEYFKSQSA